MKLQIILVQVKMNLKIVVLIIESYSHRIFFPIHTHTHVQFEQLHKYIQNRNKIYKKWYTQN